ncbi:MAG TPA: hypothetical protein VN947_36160 [Polyangia bacterium]|nr:hypothetical protein [Polyangia bacterium]
MESAEAVAAKRRVLIDALMMCLGKSRVVAVVDAKTTRGVLDSASSEMWREGEFRLDPVWKILIAQPGLTPEDVAPPLLVFKAYEQELGVLVRVPQALSAIPRGEQVRLREGLGIQRADFAAAIEEMRTLAASEANARQAQNLARAAEANESRAEPRKTAAAKSVKAPPKKQSKAAAAALGAVALAAIVVGVWFGMRDTSAAFPLGDVAGTLQLSNGKAVGPSLTATLSDPKWESMSREDRKKAASAVMDIEAGKGIHSLVLLDDGGKMRAMVTETAGGRNVIIP